MSDIRAKNPAGVWGDLRRSDNGDMLLVAGRLLSSKTLKILAATTDYAAEDVMSDGSAWEFKDVVFNKGGGGYIVKARALLSTTGLIPRLTLYLFDGSPTSAVTDNAANTALLAADINFYIGKIDFPALEDLGGYSETIATPSTYGNLPMPFVLSAVSTSIYGILVTRDAITGEAANMTMNLQLMVEAA